MKLRLHKSTIRLRLLQNEVRQFRDTGNISETIDFGVSMNEKLTYSLRNSTDAAQILVQFANNQIEILLPRKMADDWADTEIIGLYAEQKTGDTELTIIVEKDFLCLDRPKDADNKDVFPQPRMKC